MRKTFVNLGLALVVAFFSFGPVFVLAQTEGVASSSDPTGMIRASLPPELTPSLKPVVTPRPIPGVSSTPTPSVMPTNSISPMSGYLDTYGDNNIAIISTAVFGVLGIVGLSFIKKGKQNKKKDDDRCGNIRELLEQKKKELEEMVRTWPEAKIKELAKEQVLNELKKDESIRQGIIIAENVKAKYDKLKETIELLEKRYDLCMLEVPSGGNTFTGTIVEGSLKDKKILENLEIKKSYTLEDWLIHDVTVSEEQIEKLGKYLDDGPWFMNFWQDGKDDVIVVFKDKSFKIKSSDKATWQEAAEYGRLKGIPEEELIFSIP